MKFHLRVWGFVILSIKGGHSSGSGIPTSKDVARRANVSQTAVSLVLNGAAEKVGLSVDTQNRIRAAAAELGYTPNSTAQNLRRRKTRTITFISPELDNPYFAEIIEAAQLAARARGYLLDVFSASDEEGKLLAIAHLRGNISDGVITLAQTQVIWEGLRDLSKRNIRCVTLQDQGDDPAIPAVCIDLEAGGYLATRHLITCGYRKIAYIGAQLNFPLRPRERMHGYHRALREANLPICPEWQIEASKNSLTGGAEAMEALLDRAGPRPDAVFVFNDLMAVGVLHALRGRGLVVPKDMAVIGFDGIALGAFTAPTLTTIEHPRSELGREAATSLIDMLENPKKVIADKFLSGRLVVRESCGGKPLSE